jgi:hypothetical protein
MISKNLIDYSHNGVLFFNNKKNKKTGGTIECTDTY